MHWMQFVVELVKPLAWPLALIVTVLLLRKEIKNLLSLLRKLKAGPLEAEFDREVKELRAEVETELPPTPLPTPAAQERSSSQRQKLVQLSQVNPRSAIIEAWLGVEFAAQRALGQVGQSPRPNASPISLFRDLSKSQLLDPELLALFQDLRALRNQAVHVSDFNPSQEAALNYIDLALRVQSALERPRLAA
jgi:hypothetical protein